MGRCWSRHLAVGICGTDIEILTGAYGWAPPGRDRLILGHESIGKVLEAPDGCGVEKDDLVVGIVRRPDPVPSANSAVYEWDYCRNGQYTERGNNEHDGYLSERYRIQPKFVVKVDPKLGLLGVLLEPTSVVAKAWEEVDRIGGRAHWDPKTAVITGAGPIGLLAALLGVQRGIDVHVIDRMTSGLKPDLVAAVGATYHTGSIADVVEGGPDVVMECTGVDSPGARRHGARWHRRRRLPDRRVIGGSYHQHHRRWHAQPEHGARERGHFVGSVNANRRHYEAAAGALAKADGAWLAELVSRRVPLDSWPDALDRQPDDVKVVIEVTPA